MSAARAVHPSPENRRALLGALLRERFPGMVVGVPDVCACGHGEREHDDHGCTACPCQEREGRP